MCCDYLEKYARAERERQADLAAASELRSISHQNGQLLYYLNHQGKAVLSDYIGNAQVLLLPKVLSCTDTEIPVSDRIPDEAFGSCTYVEYIVCDYGKVFQFGCFCFRNCANLKGLVTLQYYQNDTPLAIEEFTFTGPDYAPKEVSLLSVIVGDRWMYYRDYDHFHPNPETEAYLNRRDERICEHYTRALHATRRFCMESQALTFGQFLRLFAIDQQSRFPEINVTDRFTAFGLFRYQHDMENHPYLYAVYDSWRLCLSSQKQ